MFRPDPKPIKQIKNKAAIKKMGTPKVPALVKKLDDIFSLFIRLRYADQNGYVKCFTSGKMYHYKETHAGHCWSRKIYALRWDEYNVQVQSYHENMHNEGNKPQFLINLREKYGQKILDYLELKRSNTFHLNPFNLQLMIKYYTEIVNKLKAERGIL